MALDFSTAGVPAEELDFSSQGEVADFSSQGEPVETPSKSFTEELGEGKQSRISLMLRRRQVNLKNLRCLSLTH